MAKQDKALTEKLTGIGYPEFEIKPGIDDLPMLHIKDTFICGVKHAMHLADDELKALIEETVAALEGPE